MHAAGRDMTRICPDCGHPTYFHRSNVVTQRLKLDEPVPCFAAVAGTTRYHYCGCTTVHPLVLDMRAS